ncbi:hypothetical protein BD626DRAFT_274758 [Schizophyllum amplum]|uniref:Uncharacterized protein n=1 Tax=Schizophyllum amplum TaxID=97359 RepID=A0A550CFR6_9AGAR|nr:hypothetical protein BD626DRAFT_274758 [Auriculariopsis ampla]
MQLPSSLAPFCSSFSWTRNTTRQTCISAGERMDLGAKTCIACFGASEQLRDSGGQLPMHRRMHSLQLHISISNPHMPAYSSTCVPLFCFDSWASQAWTNRNCRPRASIQICTRRTSASSRIHRPGYAHTPTWSRIYRFSTRAYTYANIILIGRSSTFLCS